MTRIQTFERLEAIPEPVPAGDFVVVDVIIASTSIIRILEEGASYVAPFADIDNALAFKREVDDALLVGEDAGDFIDGFDLSPLPSELSSADLAGRPVGFRSTNGTRALARVGNRDGVFIGSTINASAVARELATRGDAPRIVAAGRSGSPTPEDTAGVELIESYYRNHLGQPGPDDETLARLTATIEGSETAQWLREMGKGDDLESILSVNATRTVPRLRDGRIVA